MNGGRFFTLNLRFLFLWLHCFDGQLLNWYSGVFEHMVGIMD